MTPLEMIAEWRRGCSCAPEGRPEECPECTRALVDAIERSMTVGQTVFVIEYLRLGAEGPELVRKPLAEWPEWADRIRTMIAPNV